jgi:hypothetical protein
MAPRRIHLEDVLVVSKYSPFLCVPAPTQETNKTLSPRGETLLVLIERHLDLTFKSRP